MNTRTLLVCCGTGCLANGSKAVAEALEQALQAAHVAAIVQCVVKRTGCNGFCENGPLVRVMPDDITYYRVKPGDAEAIVAQTVVQGEAIERLLYKRDDGMRVRGKMENPFYAAQHELVLRNTGSIDPVSLEDYLARGGYTALQKALSMSPESIIREVELSGLRGRGGAGFPTGRKWRTAAGFPVFPKYVVCNGDEGDPGAFMDRSVMEGDPHSVLEGLAIAALAVGAEEGFFYVRDEYALAVEHLREALKAAEARGFLGTNVLNSGKRLQFSVVRGGGAFVCGESTALMQSIEGKVGEPRAKYIRSAQRGLWDKPTVLNNVETLANVPVILNKGGAEFARIGTEGSKGTKVFALVGKVNRTGLVEVPMGTTLRTLIETIGGGVRGGRPFKAVQTGGPSGGCIPESMLDLPVDFDTLVREGAMMGSGGMIVMDDRSCMVEVARYYINFLAGESCGKCTPCREGLRQLLHILTDICSGKGQEGDIALMEQICDTMEGSSLCALGKSAPNPVRSTLRHFRDEYEAHIREHRCPAGVCPDLTVFAVDSTACRSCGACKRVCPASAVSGKPKQPYSIDPALCIGCGSCREACRFEAISTHGRSAQ